jgi:hypothetical protein
LKSQRKAGQHFDLIFFSGDLISKGQYSDSNILLAKGFVSSVLDATGVSPDHLFFAPGNHDLELTKIPSILRPALDALNTLEKTNEFIDNIGNTPYLTAGFDSFNTFVHEVT